MRVSRRGHGQSREALGCPCRPCSIMCLWIAIHKPREYPLPLASSLAALALQCALFPQHLRAYACVTSMSGLPARGLVRTLQRLRSMCACLECEYRSRRDGVRTPSLMITTRKNKERVEEVVRPSRARSLCSRPPPLEALIGRQTWSIRRFCSIAESDRLPIAYVFRRTGERTRSQAVDQAMWDAARVGASSRVLKARLKRVFCGFCGTAVARSVCGIQDSCQNGGGEFVVASDFSSSLLSAHGLGETRKTSPGRGSGLYRARQGTSGTVDTGTTSRARTQTGSRADENTQPSDT